MVTTSVPGAMSGIELCTLSNGNLQISGYCCQPVSLPVLKQSVRRGVLFLDLGESAPCFFEHRESRPVGGQRGVSLRDDAALGGQQLRACEFALSFCFGNRALVVVSQRQNRIELQ